MTTEEDVGMLTETWWDDVLSQECDSETGSYWSMEGGVSAKGTTSEDWNQIQESESNIWRFFTHFSNRPENRTDCGWSGPWPDQFEMIVQIGDDEDNAELYFDAWEPKDGEGDSDNQLTETLLDIVGGFGGTYTGIGAAIAKFLIQDGSSTTVTAENVNSKLTFTVPLEGGYDDLPHETDKAEVAEVRIRVNSDYASGTHNLKYMPKYTFGYMEDTYFECTCHSDYTYANYKTSAPANPLKPEYDAV